MWTELTSVGISSNRDMFKNGVNFKKGLNLSISDKFQLKLYIYLFSSRHEDIGPDVTLSVSYGANHGLELIPTELRL